MVEDFTVEQKSTFFAHGEQEAGSEDENEDSEEGPNEEQHDTVQDHLQELAAVRRSLERFEILPPEIDLAIKRT